MRVSLCAGKAGVAVVFVSAVVVLFLLGCATGAPRTGVAKGDSLRGSREAFAKAFTRIKVGMPAGEVVAILGRPDDVRTEADPGGIGWTGAREIWGYGTDRHLGFATLGTVTFDEKNRVQYLSGTQGAEELVGQLGEEEVRRLLRVVDNARLTANGGWGFDPLCTIAAVNALQPLGKRVGVGVLKEYLRVSFDTWGPGDWGTILVMRGLFDVPPGDAWLRPPSLGLPEWSPVDFEVYPRFPLVIVDDIPVLPISGYTLAGAPEPAGARLEYLEEFAPWRKEPLRPSNDPLRVYDKVVEQLRGEGANGQLSTMLGQQFLRLVNTVYRDPADEGGEDEFSELNVVPALREAAQAIKEMHIRWDGGRNCYVRGDGSVLPARVVPVHRKHFFEPRFADSACRVKVVVQRWNSKRVHFSHEVEYKGSLPALRWRVIKVGRAESVLVDGPMGWPDSFGATAGESSQISGDLSLSVAAGERVEVEVTEGGRRFVSEEIEP